MESNHEGCVTQMDARRLKTLIWATVQKEYYMLSDGGGGICPTFVETLWGIFPGKALIFAAMQDCLVLGCTVNVQPSYCMPSASARL